MDYIAYLQSPLGNLRLQSDGVALTGLYMEGEMESAAAPPPPAAGTPEIAALAAAGHQLQQYFAGTRRGFDLPLNAAGTPFQRRVWQALLEIPYGATWSYGRLARHLGSPAAARAVGLANGSNPISIVIPCHRVIGANGSLTGYGGGLPRKRWLLTHERGEFSLT